MRVLLFDNYDSFTYNLLHLLAVHKHVQVSVCKNDKIDLASVKAYDKIVLSPGPGLPQQAGLLIPLIQNYYKIRPILGVCLGHQAIAVSFGGALYNLPDVFHGVSSDIIINQSMHPLLFKGMNTVLKVGRYHSWAVDAHTLSPAFEVTATDEFGTIMAMQHRNLPIHSVQFHPESILTDQGLKIVSNWLLD
ncbi:MAG: aminodeoxychorismate/anthranilate synthase component II [Phycisphaerales bacterium]|nr:aminodeoxychorismate/anthranilate synthase component II [Phycisphaerales bacterium]